MWIIWTNDQCWISSTITWQYQTMTVHKEIFTEQTFRRFFRYPDVEFSIHRNEIRLSTLYRSITFRSSFNESTTYDTPSTCNPCNEGNDSWVMEICRKLESRGCLVSLVKTFRTNGCFRSITINSIFQFIISPIRNRMKLFLLERKWYYVIMQWIYLRAHILIINTITIATITKIDS